MSDDETQRAIQFILNQQAQLTVKVDKLTDRVDDIAKNVGKLAEAQVRLAEAQLRDEGRVSQLEDSFRMLVQLARNTDERLDAMNGRLDILTNAQAETDRRLGDFITAVERYITEGRNGRPQG